MAKSAGGTKNTRHRMLIMGIAIFAITLGILLFSLRYASPALKSWSTVFALMISQPLSFLASWFAAVRLSRLAGSPASAAFSANCLSVFLSLMVPGRLFEAVKPIVLNLQIGLPLSRGFAAIALERLLDIGCLALLAALAITGASAQYTAELRHSAFVLAGLLCVGVVFLCILIARPRLGVRMVGALPFAYLRNLVTQTLEAVAEIGNLRSLAGPAGYSVLTWGASYLTALILFDLLGAIPLTPAQVLFVFVAGTLGFVVTITPGGLGTYEAAIVLALRGFGYPLADALAMAVLLRIAYLLPIIPPSAWFLARGGIKIDGLVARWRSRGTGL